MQERFERLHAFDTTTGILLEASMGLDDGKALTLRPRPLRSPR
jgi:hypothetical protein